ncbi:hypothetical protein Tco_1415614 [Tanacetum coccineum]
MPPKRNGMSAAAIEQLITQHVADALLDYETNQNNGNENNNGNGSHDLGSGSGRTLHTARGCTYKEFLNYQPLYFKGTEGAVGLAHLFEKMEYIFHISNCAVKCQVKYVTYTLLENELWNLTVKGTDLASYTQCFQELALLCSRMLPEETDKVERFIWGLPDSIQGNVTSSKPTRLQEAIKIANSLMDQKICVFAARQAHNKRRMKNNPRDDYIQQPPYKRQNVARAYTARPGEKKEYVGNLVVKIPILILGSYDFTIPQSKNDPDPT